MAHLWHALEEAQEAVQAVRVPPAGIQLARHHRHKRLLVGNQPVVGDLSAADGLLHGGLEHGGPHDEVPAVVHHHALPVALVEAEKLDHAGYEILVVDDVPRVRNHLYAHMM